MTAYTTAIAPIRLTMFSEVRCRRCSRLVVKWMRSGTAVLDIKCPRCGVQDVVQLST